MTHEFKSRSKPLTADEAIAALEPYRVEDPRFGGIVVTDARAYVANESRIISFPVADIPDGVYDAIDTDQQFSAEMIQTVCEDEPDLQYILEARCLRLAAEESNKAAGRGKTGLVGFESLAGKLAFSAADRSNGMLDGCVLWDCAGTSVSDSPVDLDVVHLCAAYLLDAVKGVRSTVVLGIPDSKYGVFAIIRPDGQRHDICAYELDL